MKNLLLSGLALGVLTVSAVSHSMFSRMGQRVLRPYNIGKQRLIIGYRAAPRSLRPGLAVRLGTYGSLGLDTGLGLKSAQEDTTHKSFSDSTQDEFFSQPA